MVGSNVNRWTEEQRQLMRQLRAGGIGWDHVAERVGHSVASCRATMSYDNTHLRSLQAKAERKALREAADRVNTIEVAPAPALKKKPALPLRAPAGAPVKPPEPGDYARSSISTARLLMDAELRRRIEVLGVTGGLLGDPEPGRSALDQRNGTVPR